tara:strand:+ start:612 stop:755 length:144 start_codon:yes stop_codon:yes gene_type:complete
MAAFEQFLVLFLEQSNIFPSLKVIFRLLLLSTAFFSTLISDTNPSKN